MKKTYILLVWILLGSLLSLGAQDASLKLTIIYDNTLHNQELRPDWGFACLIESSGEKLMFDAGNNEMLFVGNMEKLGIDASEIPNLFISHHHGDHTAGLQWLCSQNTSMKCYLPTGYMEDLEQKGKLPEHSESHAEPAGLFGPFYTTGDSFEAFPEQGLVVKTETGGVLITGCGHPNPVAMISKAEKELGIQIHTLIGGLHLMRYSDKQLERLSNELKALGIKHICPTHCTGDHSIDFLAEAFGDGYIQGGAGREIMIK